MKPDPAPTLEQLLVELMTADKAERQAIIDRWKGNEKRWKQLKTELRQMLTAEDADDLPF